MQTRLHSLRETLISTVVGFVISLTATSILLPLHGFESTAGINVLLTLEFTVISILRGYGLRRFFNWLDHKG